MAQAIRGIGRWLGRALLVLLLAGAALWIFGPYEPDDLSAEFDPRKFGEGVDVYLESTEANVPNLRPDTHKRVIWAKGSEIRTPVSVVYLHGFSASSEEIRPVPDRIAQALGANLVFTRLTGHGRDAAAMGEVSVAAWMADTAEALALARAVGEQVVVISTSTGGTLAAAAALDPELSRDVAAMIFVSPNFGLNTPVAPLLTLPAARYWLPLLAGQERSFETRAPEQAIYWTTRYPSVAVFPLAALVRKVAGLDFSAARVPALFWISDDDMIVRPDIARDIAGRWGGPTELRAVTMGPEDDPSSHVLTGDILSPGQTEASVAAMLDWLAAQGL